MLIPIQDEILTITEAFDWADFTWLRAKRRMVDAGTGVNTADYIGSDFFDSDTVTYDALVYDNFYQSLGSKIYDS